MTISKHTPGYHHTHMDFWV